MEKIEIDREKTRRLPKYRRAPDKFGAFRVTPRDIDILDLVHDYRHVWIDHIQALVPGSNRQLALRVQGLFHHGYVDRLVPQSKLRLELGSPKMVYALAPEGAKLLAGHRGMTLEELGWHTSHNRRKEMFVEHQVEISNFHTALALAIDQDPDLELIEWDQSLETRHFVELRGPDGQNIVYRVAPDAYFAVEDGGQRRNFFLELERGTEEYRRLYWKFESYWWYLPRQGEAESSPYFQRYENPTDVRVLVVTTPYRSTRSDVLPRVDRMLDELLKLDPKRKRGLNRFWFTTMDQYSLGDPKKLLAPIWRTLSPKPRQLF